MRANAIVATAVVSFWLCSPVQANKYRIGRADCQSRGDRHQPVT